MASFDTWGRRKLDTFYRKSDVLEHARRRPDAIGAMNIEKAPADSHDYG